MNRMSVLRIQRLATLSVAILLVGCEANPTQLVVEPVVAAAKPVKPPTDVGGELELKAYFVVAAPGPHGFTDNKEVNVAVYEYLDTQDPPSGLVSPGFESWGDFLGCPGTGEYCSAVTLVMNGGKALAFYAQAVPVVGECGESTVESCILDTDLLNRRDATVRGGIAVPYIPWDLIKPAFGTNEEGSTTFRFYWQGQRGMDRRWDTGETEKVRGKLNPVYQTDWNWDLFPNLYPQQSSDEFFFHPMFRTGNLTYHHPTYSDARLLEICDTLGCLAAFKGKQGNAELDIEMDGGFIDGIDGTAEFWVEAVKTGTGEPEDNPESFGRVMLTHPGGTREMLEYEWVTRTSVSRDDDGRAATWYRLEGLNPNLCYQFDLVGLTVVESEWETFAEDNRLVWDGQQAPLLLGSCPGD